MSTDLIRRLPFGNGFAVFAGLEQAVGYLEELHFTEEDIAYLAEQEENSDPAFLDLLRSFRFTGNISVPVKAHLSLPGEPILRLEGPIMDLQLVETALLNFIRSQTLIATKAARIRQVVPDDYLMEFGTRRAQEGDAAVWGARAALFGWI